MKVDALQMPCTYIIVRDSYAPLLRELAYLSMEPLTTLCLCLAIAGVAVATKWKIKRGQRPHRKLLPGPTGFALYRDFATAVFQQKTFLQFGKWAVQYGDVFRVSVPGQTIIVLNSSSAIKEMFAGESKNITSDRPPSFLGKYFFGQQGITFSPHGKVWKRLKQLFHLSLNMHADGGQRVEATLRSELDIVLAELDGCSENSVDVTGMVSKYLMTVLHIMLTGERPPTGSRNIQLMKDLDDHMSSFLLLDTEAFMSMFPFLRYIPNPYRWAWLKLQRIRGDLTKILFTDYSSNFQTGDGLIDKFLAAMSEENSIITDSQVQALTFEMIGAGYVTSKSILMSIMLLILHKPEVQARLQREVDAVINGQAPHLKDRQSMPYFDAFLMEIMRFASQLPLGIPHAASENFEFRGWFIPKGATIVPNFFSANHDERVWDNPWEFRPERFLKDDGQLAGPLSDIRQRFVLFGVGNRLCPGQNFAKSRIFLFVAMLFQQYEFLPSGNEPLQSCNPYDWTPGLTIMPGQLNCRIRRRADVRSKLP